MEKNIRAAAVKTAMTALKWVSDRCDGAISNDGQGFSGVDSALGNALAEKSVWTLGELHAALLLIVKYQKQIDRAGVSRAGLDELRVQVIAERGKKASPVSRSDVVRGTISVDERAGRIVLVTDFHPRLVAQIRNLVDRKWDGAKWTSALCCGNAVAVEEIAEAWGLDLRRHNGWSQLVPPRQVSHDGQWLRIDGVDANSIRKSLPELRGDPEVDERVFTAIRMRGDSTIEVALRSWVIRDARLWIEALPEDLERRLAWAREQVSAILDEAYPRAVREERVLYAQASASRVAGDVSENLRALLPTPLASSLMPHQLVAVKALVEREQCLLADEQGLGKSIEILSALEVARAFPSVIVVPATAILNWRDEIARWLPHRQIALAGGGIVKKEQGVPFGTADIVVVNYESFEKHAAELASMHPKALVLDEGQYLKTHNAARTMAVKAFCAESGVERVIVATGTPVLNRPAELLTLLTLFPDLLAELGGFGRFASRYCAVTRREVGRETYLDFGGAANLGELGNRLRETGRFIRREKAAVLPDLPGKQREEVTVEIDNRAEYDLAKHDLAAWLKTKNSGRRSRKRSIDENGETAALCATAEWMGWTAEGAREMGFDTADRAEALRRLGALRQLAGVGKMAAAADWISAVVRDEKVVVFAYHVEVQQSIVAALEVKGVMTPLIISGEMNAKARHAAIRAFQQDPDCRLIVCSLSAARTAITLTAARRALMVELDWSPASMEQAEDRLHRIGQAGQVTITYMHATETLDDRMFSVLDRKRAVIDKIASGCAPYGFKPDGTPRLRPAGPGRPPLEASTRAERRNASKAKWQAANGQYARDYMRQRRLTKKVELARQSIADHDEMCRVGLEKYRRMCDDHSLTQWDYDRDLEQAAKKADSARRFLASIVEPGAVVGVSPPVQGPERP